MTIKEAILQSLEDLKSTSTHSDVYEQIIKQNYYDFRNGKTPKATISAQLGTFIRNNDTRVKRIKVEGGAFGYYLAKNEQDINLEDISAQVNKEDITVGTTYHERDLHKLLSSYLKNQNIYSKTIFHEQSKNSNDSHQKWIHPDMIGIKFTKLSSKVNQTFMKVLNKSDTFKLTSYEIKKDINTDYELKKSYFQAVSNSSWANYGYLVALDISDNLMDEMERLNQSFGIGIIELNSNPYESKILFSSKYKELDFKTIDKLCKVNKDFEDFVELTEKSLTASDRYIESIEKELDGFCDAYFINDSEIEKYCIEQGIPFQNEYK